MVSKIIFTSLIVAASISESSSFTPSVPQRCTSSPLFTNRRNGISNRVEYKPNFSQLRASSESPKDAEVVDKTGTSTSKTDKSVFEKFDEYCLALKPMALEANEKAQTFMDNQTKKILYTTKACGLFSLFILYRAYRGLFYILPEVFREVYRKMEKTVRDPFDESELNGSDDLDPQTGEVRFRSKVVISMLTTLVTLSYVVTGAFKVFSMFIGTATRTSSVEPAFEAAADEILTNEEKVMKLANKKKGLNGDVNGAELKP